MFPPRRTQGYYEDEEEEDYVIDTDEREERQRDFDIKDLPGFEAY